MIRTQRSNFAKIKQGLPSIISRPLSSLSSLLTLCTTTHLLLQVHSRFFIHGLHQNQTLSTHLIQRYADLGRPDVSLQIFHSILSPHAAAPLYSSLLRTLHGGPDRTLSSYRDLLAKSLVADRSAYPLLINACVVLPGTGRQVHAHVVRFGFEADALVAAALFEMYRNTGEISDACNVFDRMPVKSLASWNLVISAVADHHCDPMEAFRMIRRMILDGFMPNSATVISLLRSCVDLGNLSLGRYVHALVVVHGLGGDLAVSTCLLMMYCKLGCLEAARLLFDTMEERDSAAWNVMISGYARSKLPGMALALLVEMGKSGCRADLFTAIACLASAAEWKSLAHGKEIHAHVVRNGTDYQVSVRNSLLQMYCHCRRPDMARRVFDSLTGKTTVSWSLMIKGYVINDDSSSALSLFYEMKMDGIKVDPIMLMNILPACVNMGALEMVRNIHGFSIKLGLSTVVSTSTALLVSYAKCGCIEMAQEIFTEENCNHRDIVSWNSMIGAYSKHGDWDRCFKLYNQMKEFGIVPDHVTFIALLTASANSGLVKEGWACFSEMVHIYGLQPHQEHYACMVDLLGRYGHLDEALNLIEKMPFKADVRVWGPLLSACKRHSDSRLAELAAAKLIKMEPTNPGNYVLLSNIYAAARKWDGVAKMRGFLRQGGLKKTPGCSWLEINGHVHEFHVMDHSHPQSQDIYTMLCSIEREIGLDASHLSRKTAWPQQ